MLFTPALTVHVSRVCQQPPPAVLLFFHFFPKRLHILAKSKVAVELWALQVFGGGTGSLKALMTDMVAAASRHQDLCVFPVKPVLSSS